MSQKITPQSEIRIIDAAQERLKEDTPIHSLAPDLDRLFEVHRSRIQALCQRIVGDPERARELTQETLLVAWERLPEFHGGARFSTWIHGIARNLCFNAVRRRGETLSEDGLLEGESGEPPIEEALIAREREAVLIAAAAVLSEKEQEVVYLRYVEELPIEVIDRLANLSGTGARSVLQTVRRKLHREIRAQLAQRGLSTSFIR